MLSFVFLLIYTVSTFFRTVPHTSTSPDAKSDIRPVSASAHTLSFTSSRQAVPPRDHATLSVYAPDMSICLISGGIYGAGQQISLPNWSGWTGTLITAQSYILSCTETSGTKVSRSITVTILPPTTTPTSPIIPSATSSPKEQSSPLLITTSHRFHEGKMFGGWGPHLGHLVRSSDGALWFVDDRGNDVMQNAGLTYFKKSNDKWEKVLEKSFFGSIQQNTASILKNDIIFTYGADSAQQRIEECYFIIATQAHACNTIPIDIGPQANYIGAAVSPAGYVIVWWTNVREGGGEFGYIANYGGGWNGPTKGTIGGYSDISYVNIAFSGPTTFSMVGQAVSGTAPQWSYTGVFADGTMGKVIAQWQQLSSLSSDPVQSTNDIYIDPTGGTHILMRTQRGVSYHFRPAGKVTEGGFDIPDAYRARFVVSTDTLHLIYSIKDKLYHHTYTTPSNTPLTAPQSSSLVQIPPSFGTIYAIYPESHIYQTSSSQKISIAYTGSGKQNEVYEYVIK